MPRETVVKTLIIVIPYLVGLALSSTVLPQATQIEKVATKDSKESSIHTTQDIPSSPFQGLSFAIHRNGEPSPCGSTTTNFEEIVGTLGSSKDGDFKSVEFTKHKVDNVLTTVFGHHLLPQTSCGPEQPPDSIKGARRKNWGRGENYKISGVDSSFLTFCDMGEEHTPVLHDHQKLMPVRSAGNVESLPCHFHTREGLRITSMKQLYEMAETLNTDQDCSVSADGEQTCQESKMIHLFAVPAGRVFMFAPSYVGETFILPHVHHPANPEPVTLKVLSVSPKVLDVINFFEEDESKAIVHKALNEKSESHRIKRSSTGASGYNVNSQRTSENGFDTHGEVAIAVKKRSLEMLGYDEYIESYTDGLQVLRYNKTTAYIPHMDWIDDPGNTNSHDFNSAGVGTNRFATVLLYMTNLTADRDGGETVFKNGWPVDIPLEERRGRADVLNELRASGEVSFLKEGSWEETMVADCRSRLAVRPHAGRAVLFYSQHPNGEEDTSSMHGGCPVLHGEKWAANNWVWNGPRGGFPGSPINKNFKGQQEDVDPGRLSGVFTNSGKDPKYNKAKLYFQETVWGDFGSGKSYSVNTYEGHEWNVKDADGTLLKQWIVDKAPKSQKFTV